MNLRRIAVLVAMAVVVIGVFTIMGAHANATWSGFGIGLVVAAGLALLIGNRSMARIMALPRTRLIGRWAAIALMVVCLPALVIGLWSPAIKMSLDRWSANGKQTLANALDKGSLKSEPESGVIATTNEQAASYNEQGEVVCLIPKGVTVRAIRLDGKPASENLEGMVKIMLKNKFGDFVDGNIVYVPSRKITLS